MRRTDGGLRLSIFDVMVLIATIAVVLRGVIEVPRIVRSSVYAEAAAAASGAAAEAEAGGDMTGATGLRVYAADVASRADRSRPDPVGYACYILTLAGGAITLTAAGVVLVARRVRRRRARD